MERICRCVVDHRPAYDELHRHHVWPLGEGGPDIDSNLMILCPTMHANAHKLWRRYKKLGGPPPWSELREFAPYCRYIVSIGWRQKEAANAVPD